MEVTENSGDDEIDVSDKNTYQKLYDTGVSSLR